MAQVDLYGAPGSTADGSNAQAPYAALPGSNPPASQAPIDYSQFYGQKPGIAAAYQKYLGRNVRETMPGTTEGEYQYWLGNPNYEEGIKNSPEAQAYAASLQQTPYQQATGGGAPAAGGNVFTDPATQQFESMLNARIAQLQTPYNNPDYQPAIDQLHKYLGQLNGPAYTPAQMDLMQTQALDPMERQRTAAKQQATERLAARGITPGSGIMEKALEDIDNQFNTIRANTQSQFATNAIGLDRQNAASAAQLAPLIAQMQQGNFNAQDARNQQAVQVAQIIPQLSWDRLMQANGLMTQTNPLAAGALAQSYQNQGYNQSADFMSGLTSILASLFGLGGR